MNVMQRPRIGLWVLIAGAILALSSSQALAQKTDYQPGEKIEYKISDYPEVWEEATFLRTSQDGSQPIIRQKPNEFTRDGFQRAATWAAIRPVAQPADAPTPPPRPRPTPVPAEPPVDPIPADEPAAANDMGVGLMSRADVLAALQTISKKDVAEMIKSRGLDFRFTSADAGFYSKLSKYGATSDITFPLADNFGAPTRQAWLMGSWQLGKIGRTVDEEKEDYTLRHGEIGVANVGALRLNANGTFAWSSTTAQSTNGQWRVATHEEMKSEGGDGIVLLSAKNGDDWLVTKDRKTGLPGSWIAISELSTRQVNEYGSRR